MSVREGLTVREMVREIQIEIRDSDLTPERGRTLLTKLTAMIGNCNDAVRRADLAYAEVLLQHLGSEEKANRARIRSETTKEFLDKREARDTRELVVEMARSLKYLLRSLEEELRLTR